VSDDLFGDDVRQRIYERCLEERNSNLWNFKRYYFASSVYRWFDVGTNLLIAILGGVLTYNFAWEVLPVYIMILVSLVIGGLSLYKAIDKPGEKAERLHSTGRRFQRLFDELQDFIELELKDDTYDNGELKERFSDLAEKRHILKQEAPPLSGIWYRWIKWRREDQIYEEAATTPEEREKLEHMFNNHADQ